MTPQGQYQATLASPPPAHSAQLDYEALCPFGAHAPNEDQLAEARYAGQCQRAEHTGYYQALYAGHVAEAPFRANGSSGGLASWLLHEALRTGMVDRVIHVKPSAQGANSSTPLFTYSLSDSADEVLLGAKSRYYPVELSQVLAEVERQPGRYAVVGIPCFIKGVRLLQRQRPLLAERIVFCLGLVCGHLKSQAYAQSLAWQMGIEPQALTDIDFRVKQPDRPANQYATAARGKDVRREQLNNGLFGTDWGAGAFKYKACDFCDDVFAETADAVVGDAWLPEYVADWRGTNILLTRESWVTRLVEQAQSTGRLSLERLSVEAAVRSQSAGIRHRREALGYRLFLAQAEGGWVPTKRFAAAPSGLERKERRRQRQRLVLRRQSHQAFARAREANQLALYLVPMQRLYRGYRRAMGKGWLSMSWQRLKRILKRVVRPL